MTPPRSYWPLPEGDAGDDFLRDLVSRKEFARDGPAPDGHAPDGHAPDSHAPDGHAPDGHAPDSHARATVHLSGMHLTGAQQFVRDFLSPDTDYPRLLLNWQTGAGKTIAAIAIALEFARCFRDRARLVGGPPVGITVVSFTSNDTFIRDMLEHPEFGFITRDELAGLHALQTAAQGAGEAAATAAAAYATLRGNYRRRLTDRSRGGLFRFYGYKEFTNRIFQVTVPGRTRGFTPASLYVSGGDLPTLLMAAVRAGDVEVSASMLDSLRGGLLIADEIHNAYNVQQRNNYGAAIQYVLDTLGDDAPRTLFMTATPVTGSAAEVVDLLNLLVPRAALPGGALLQRNDFFVRTTARSDEPVESSFIVSQLRPDALDRLARLSAGRVSFLLDANTSQYPKRVLEGEEVLGVPYLRLTLCPMSPLHAETIARRGAAEGAGLPADSLSLYDMVFPDPGDSTNGLYRTSDVISALTKAPDAWKLANGVVVAPLDDIPTVTGDFLSAEPLARYGAKYARLITDVLAELRRFPGKFICYHPRVRLTGVLLLGEIFRANGFIPLGASFAASTVCALCGVAHHGHGAAQHDYTPARYAVIHGELDAREQRRLRDVFNSPGNARGTECTVLLGSKVIRESLNFSAVRRLYITSYPTDYPTILQIVGRAVRKRSHAALPPAEWTTAIRIYVSAYGDGRPSPELQRYIDKGREYLIIQEVERALRAAAVDRFINRKRVADALRGDDASGDRATLDALPLSLPAPPRTQIQTATFEAYGHGLREVTHVMAICRALFHDRPVWTFEHLWDAIRGGAVAGTNDPYYFEQDSLALALTRLARPAGAPPRCILRAGRFYVQFRVDAAGRPIADIESYMRGSNAGVARVAYSVPELTMVSRDDHIFASELRGFIRDYIAAPRAIELSLVDLSGDFHTRLLRRLVEGGPVPPEVEKAKRLYDRFRLSVLASAVPPAHRRGRIASAPGNTQVGYITRDAARLYDADSGWYEIPLGSVGYGRRQVENNIVVAFCEDVDRTNARLKLRTPLHLLVRHHDLREVARGSVCETRTRIDLHKMTTRLRPLIEKIQRRGARRAVGGAAPAVRPDDIYDEGPLEVDEAPLEDDVDEAPLEDEGDKEPLEDDAQDENTFLLYATKFDKSKLYRIPPAGVLCMTLRLQLLALEEYERGIPEGLAQGLRWLYMYCDRPPNPASVN